MFKLCRESGQRMQILTYFSLLTSRGHKAAATGALQARERSSSPAKTAAVMPLLEVKATILLPRQRGHNPPEPGRTTLQRAGRAGNFPQPPSKAAPRMGRGQGQRGWTLWVDCSGIWTHTESQGLHEGQLGIPEGRKSQPGEEVWLGSPSSR